MKRWAESMPQCCELIVAIHPRMRSYETADFWQEDLADFENIRCALSFKWMALAMHNFSKRRVRANRLRYQNINLSSGRRTQLCRRLRSRKIRTLIGTVLINFFKPRIERKIQCKICSENWWQLHVTTRHLVSTSGSAGSAVPAGWGSKN